uniref:Reverse transcriptase domain-containing protein n=1 Tax=Echinostoma caproni TaxID=27848 RepID=A0A183B1X4_9TREM
LLKTLKDMARPDDPADVLGLQMSMEPFRLIVDSTRLTHTHPLAIYGALLIAFAVRGVWHAVSVGRGTINPIEFLDGLLARLARVQYEFVKSTHPVWKSAFDQYAARFDIIKKFLTGPNDPSVEEIVRHLGPSTIFLWKAASFHERQAGFQLGRGIIEQIFTLRQVLDMRHTHRRPTIAVFLDLKEAFDSVDREALLGSLLRKGIPRNLGGDTDTIGTMACALAGGYAGLSEVEMNSDDSPIPNRILARCERIHIIKEFAQWLCDRCSN